MPVWQPVASSTKLVLVQAQILKDKRIATSSFIGFETLDKSFNVSEPQGFLSYKNVHSFLQHIFPKGEICPRCQRCYDGDRFQLGKKGVDQISRCPSVGGEPVGTA